MSRKTRPAKNAASKKKLTARSTSKSKSRRRLVASVDPEERKFCERVGANIARVRKSKGWTQDRFEEFGIGLRDYQRIEAGERNLTFRLLLRIAKALGVDPSELTKPL
jgi:ribosome-binding protein aMBF1 (putative translation factor)